MAKPIFQNPHMILYFIIVLYLCLATKCSEGRQEKFINSEQNQAIVYHKQFSHPHLLASPPNYIQKRPTTPGHSPGGGHYGPGGARRPGSGHHVLRNGRLGPDIGH
ncbi:hypothetical protein CASFOL_021811 [Castilleja foliolosa]|uniref:Uncharacterized protein n=1 Tax=Castilleja foliolosa TaxID=1961234 RepID=A0ABD3D1S9_9LAMI